MNNLIKDKSIVFIYYKDDKIKAIDDRKEQTEHDELISSGWQHKGTLDVCVFIEELYNHVPEEELQRAIKSIAIV